VERHVKERLIGAAVLVAAAVLLIPEMLSGPDRVAHGEYTGPAAGNAPLKTYTIDLNRPPAGSSAPVAAEAIPDQAPPPELMPQSNVQSPVEASPSAQHQAVPESAADHDMVPAPAAARPPPVAQSAQTQAPEVAPLKTTKAPAAAVDTSASSSQASTVAHVSKPAPAGEWAVQLGSFSNQATAGNMVKHLRTDGYAAFVMPVKAGNSTLYRVRIGPMDNREAAAKVLGQIKSKVQGAAIVKHP